jgi:membrane fusion protein, multidrug efflux system
MIRIRTALSAALIIMMMGLLSCTPAADETESPADTVSAATDYAPLVSAAVQVVRAPLREEFVGNGAIAGQEEAVLRTRIGGVIASIDFQLGQALEQGQVVMTLDDRIVSLNLRQLEQQFETAVKNLESSTRLYDRGSISLSQLNQERAALDGLEAQLSAARDNLENTRITTPISGSVAQRSPSLIIGDQIQAGVQIGRVVDLEHLRIQLSVGQSELFLLSVGDAAVIDIPTPTGTLTTNGVVSAISAGSDERTGSWAVLVDFNNPRPKVVRAGLSAKVTVKDADAAIYTVVPNAALVYRDGKQYVFIVEGTTAKMTAVTVLDQYGDLTAVAGLDPTIELLDHKVLVSGLTRIKDGDETVIK